MKKTVTDVAVFHHKSILKVYSCAITMRCVFPLLVLMR